MSQYYRSSVVAASEGTGIPVVTALFSDQLNQSNRLCLLEFILEWTLFKTSQFPVFGGAKCFAILSVDLEGAPAHSFIKPCSRRSSMIC
jgi:hypothetical protein